MRASMFLRRGFAYCCHAFSELWAVGFLLVLWQVWVDTTTPNSLIVVPPLEVLRDIGASPLRYAEAAVWTLGIALAGLVSGILLGLILAILAWTSELVSGFLGPSAILVASTPVVCIIPLLARIFGYRTATEYFTVLIMMFFPSFVFAASGLRNLPAMSNQLLGTWGTTRSKQLWLLALPAALPSLATALRTGAAASILVAVVAEYLMQTGGLGALFAATMQQFNIPRAFGASIVAMILSATLYALAGLVEDRVHTIYGRD